MSHRDVSGGSELAPYGAGTLPTGIRSRLVPGLNGLTVHLLEAGFESADRPLVMLLHGVPEQAYSWRKIMLPLARAGFHVVAADQRGYGRTTGWDPSYDASTHPFGFLNVVTDTLTLAAALGAEQVACVVGHDAGSPAAAWCALLRPDVFRSVVMMSAPFSGPPALPATDDGSAPLSPAQSDDALDAQLAALGVIDIRHGWTAVAGFAAKSGHPATGFVGLALVTTRRWVASRPGKAASSIAARTASRSAVPSIP